MAHYYLLCLPFFYVYKFFVVPLKLSIFSEVIIYKTVNGPPSSSNTPFKDSSLPSTSKHQTGSSTDTPGTTTLTSNRQALYQRGTSVFLVNVTHQTLLDPMQRRPR
ncbi:hypothetical protein BYT27DRAFT_6780239 [Phlegmacium glaucopus]|nr:hypothetical protein BYT27DRAFT_6780239 [Phlegmacium glaucopus]